MANLKISQLPSAATATTADILAIVNGGVTSKITLGDVVNLTAFGVSGNTSGTCISDIYVSNVNSCSPLTFTSDGKLIATLTKTSGFAMESGSNFVIPTGSAIVDGVGDAMLEEGSSTNKFSADGKTGFASDYWDGDGLYRTSVSGTSTGVTATTKFDTSNDFKNGLTRGRVDWVDEDGSVIPACPAFNSYKTYSSTDLIISDTITGLKAGAFNVDFINEYNLESGTYTSKIDGGSALILTKTELSAPKIKTVKGVFNFGDTSTPIPATVDADGTEGDMVAGGGYIYVYLSGSWARAELFGF